MIEGRDTNSGIVRGRQKRITRTEAGANNSQPCVTLLLQPIEATANVNDALPAGIECPANVCRYCIIGALDLRRTANVVIRHAQAENGNIEQIQSAA